MNRLQKTSKIFIVGHNDIIEKSLLGYFRSHGFENVFSSSEMALNTTIQPSVYQFFSEQRPEYVFLTSTRSGGIDANQKYAAEFIYHNLESQNNILYAAHKFGVKKLLYVASSCVYPKECAQPIKEDYLLTGPLEVTSEAYSIAKIAGIKLCQSFRRQYGFNAIVMIPATIYGPLGDEDPAKAHVIGALMAKFQKAVQDKQSKVEVWGTGKPKREFLYTEDFVNACLFLMEHYEGEEMLNVGCGYDVTIKELAGTIAETVGYSGQIIFDDSKPDGTMQKLLDSTRMHNLGWKVQTKLKEGISRLAISLQPSDVSKK